MTAAAELVDVEPLTPYENNARTHSPEQIEQLKASIRKFGFVGVIGYDGKGLAIGHGRRQAALEMWAAGEEIFGPGKRAVLPTGKLPGIDLSGLTEEERRALILADNQISLNAGWDETKLLAELEALQAVDFPIDLIGFDEAELARLFNPASPGLTDPDEVPDAPAVPVTQRGDCWLLGEAHRLKCGDATCAADVESVLNGQVPHLMVTDPPYGVEYAANWRNERVRQDGSLIGGRAIGAVENDDRADWREAFSLFAGDVAYAWSADLRSKEAIEALEACGFEIRAQIIWAKQQFAIGRGDYHFQHEPCWYAVRKGKKGHWNGDRKQTTLWNIDKPHKSETGHSTQKPVECMKRPIENNSKAGDYVYDPFIGSGTSAIAAEMLGRKCLALELNPAYVDLSILRWMQFSGGTAILESTGQTFAEVKAEREAAVEAA